MSKTKTLKIAPETTAAPPEANGVAAPAAGGFGGKKTVCPLGRAQFRAAAKSILVDVGGAKVKADPKEFSTGSFGYYANGKVDLEVGGVLVTFQVGLNLTAVGSKSLPKA